MDWRKKVWAAVAVVLVYFSAFQPSDWLRDAAYAAWPLPYEGVGIFVPHLLYYSTLTAVLAALCWWALARKGVLPYPQMALSVPVAGWALGAGMVSVLASLAFLWSVDMGELRWIGFDGWKIAGNLFSNFYEEFIYRGFLLVGLTVLFGFWPAAILSSLAFGLSHDQYPLILQLFAAALGVLWCWIARQARSIWAAWGAHMIVDVVIDAIWG